MFHNDKKGVDKKNILQGICAYGYDAMRYIILITLRNPDVFLLLSGTCFQSNNAGINAYK